MAHLSGIKTDKNTIEKDKADDKMTKSAAKPSKNVA